MLAIVGLGNPGRKYARTRHNVGLEVLDHLHSRLSASRWKTKRRMRCQLSWVTQETTEVVIAKPNTYVNRSGKPVSDLLRLYHLFPDQMLVVHDDLDLPFGRLRIYRGRGSGGHNGLRSIEQHLGTKEFARLKVGIGRPPGSADPADFVLSRFSKREAEDMEIAMSAATDLACEWVADSGMGTVTVDPLSKK